MEIEHQTVLTPKFNTETGLVRVIIQDRGTLRVLMLSQTNEAGYIETLETGEAVLWSRSKQRPWRPKASDEKAVPVHRVIIDCQGSNLLFLVAEGTAICHTSAPSCFYRCAVLCPTLDPAPNEQRWDRLSPMPVRVHPRIMESCGGR